MRVICIIAALVFALPIVYGADEVPEVKVKVVGTLQNDEASSQITVEQDGWSFVLDFGKDSEMKKSAAQYAKRPVFVVGTLTAPGNTPTVKVDYIGIKTLAPKFHPTAEHAIPTLYSAERFSF